MNARRLPRWVIGTQPDRRDGADTVGPSTTAGQWLQLGAVMALAAVLYLVHSFLRFRNFEAKGYDLGIFDQAVRQYALFREPLVPVKGVDFNILGDHFHPILALLAPLYWVWDDPRMLNIAMTALLAGADVEQVELVSRRRHRPRSFRAWPSCCRSCLSSWLAPSPPTIAGASRRGSHRTASTRMRCDAG